MKKQHACIAGVYTYVGVLRLKGNHMQTEYNGPPLFHKKLSAHSIYGPTVYVITLLKSAESQVLSLGR